MTTPTTLIEEKMKEFEQKYNSDWCLSGCLTGYDNTPQEECIYPIKSFLRTSLTQAYERGREETAREINDLVSICPSAPMVFKAIENYAKSKGINLN
jgi:hypothetical protein